MFNRWTTSRTLSIVKTQARFFILFRLLTGNRKSGRSFLSQLGSSKLEQLRWRHMIWPKLTIQRSCHGTIPAYYTYCTHSTTNWRLHKADRLSNLPKIPPISGPTNGIQKKYSELRTRADPLKSLVKKIDQQKHKPECFVSKYYWSHTSWAKVTCWIYCTTGIWSIR